MRHIGLISLTLLAGAITSMAQPPEGYYLPAAGKTGTELRTALYNIIRGHTVSTYTDLWTHFQTTDDTPDGKVWDMYSDKPGFAPPYVYVFGDNQCGNYTKEGDCYNREHSFPKAGLVVKCCQCILIFTMFIPPTGGLTTRGATTPSA